MEKTVVLTYHGPDEIRVIREMQDGLGTFTFVKGVPLPNVPEKFALQLIKDMNQREFTKDQMDLARAYDCHIFEVEQDAGSVPFKQKGGDR